MLYRLVLGVMNAKLKPCVLSLVKSSVFSSVFKPDAFCVDQVNGIRMAGALMTFWTSLLALVTSLVDDPAKTILFEVRSCLLLA